jgi:transcriptional regulator with XRE-family HTH domain
VTDTVTPIPKRELLAYQADVKGAIFRQIRETFSRLKQRGFTQKDLAIKIGMNEGQLSRRLRGDYDLRLETLSDLARGLDCRIDVKLTPISSTLVFASDRAAASAVRKSVWFREASTSEKYHEMRSKVLKEHPIKEPKHFAFSSGKPSARRCKEQKLSDRRLFGKRTATQISSLRTRRSPWGDAKLYALYRVVQK